MKPNYLFHRITLLVIALIVGTNGFAQTIDVRLKQLEQIKSTYGEMDERYLSALSEVAGKAIGENNIGVAIQLRQQHTELIKQKYGESSIQYAEGLVRNAACIILSETNGGENTSPSAFQQLERSIKLFEQNNVKYNELYLLALYEVASYYAKNNKYDRAFLYLNKNIELYRDKCRNTADTSIAVSYFESLLIHTIWSGSVGDCHKRIVYSREADSILTKWNIQRYLYPSYILGLYKGLSVCYQENDDIASRKMADEKYGKYAKMLLGGMSEEYIFNLRVLANDYFRLNQFSEAISTQKNYIRRVRALGKKKKISEMDDSLYFQSLSDQALICRIAVQQNDSASYWQTYYDVSNTIKSYLENKGDTLSEMYVNSLRTILHFSQMNNKPEEYNRTYKRLEAIVKQTYDGHNETFYDAIYTFNDLPTYQEYVDRIHLLKQQGYSDNRIIIWRKLGEISHRAVRGRYKGLDSIINEVYTIIGERESKFIDVSDSISTLAEVHRYDGLYHIKQRDTIAYVLLIAAMNECESIGDTASVFTIISDLGMYYSEVAEDGNKAMEMYQLYIGYLYSKGDTTSENYFLTCNNLAFHMIDMGELASGISLLENIAIRERKILGDKSRYYASTLHNISLFYSRINNPNIALSYAKQSAEIYRYLDGDTSDNYATALFLMCDIQYQNDSIDRAIEYANRAIEILKILYGELSPQLITPYGSLIKFLAEKNDINGITEVNRLVSAIWEKYDLAGTAIGAAYMSQLGDILFAQGDPKSYDMYANYIHTIDSLGYRNSTKIFEVYPNYIMSLFIKGEKISEKDEIEYVEYMLNLVQYHYWSKGRILNQKQREDFLTKKEFLAYKDCFFSLRKTESTNIFLFNYLLLNKGLLMATALDYAKTIYESGDSILIKRYENLQAATQNNSSSNYEEIAKNQNEEREIVIAASKLGTSDYVSCNYDSILSVIKDNEVAVEYVAYNDYNRLNEGIIEKRYAVLVVRKDLHRPQFIPLCTAEEIEPLVNGNPNLMYNGGELSQSILNLLWKPIEKYVHKGDVVFFSPDGCLYKLALENIQVAENVTLGTKYNMHRCSSTRQIRDRQIESKYRNAVLYGGLSYDVDEDTMRNNSRRYAPSMTRGYTPAFGENDAIVRRGWNYLPGTKQEIDDVSAILRKKKIVCNTYSGAEGNEESFKALSGSNISILHIATHGFYIQEANAEKVRMMQQPQWMQNTSMIDKALRRSGLMLAGGNNAWKAGHGIEGIEDGVLTAQEISNMNLASVDLLVLSACETGLGDVANEGVFGLQWAFKSAGVGTIIMSLWDVDDNATALMMKTFYRELTAGKDKREAFTLAQKEVKKIYKDPLQWAAFIMLD